MQEVMDWIGPAIKSMVQTNTGLFRGLMRGGIATPPMTPLQVTAVRVAMQVTPEASHHHLWVPYKMELSDRSHRISAWLTSECFNSFTESVCWRFVW